MANKILIEDQSGNPIELFQPEGGLKRNWQNGLSGPSRLGHFSNAINSLLQLMSAYRVNGTTARHDGPLRQEPRMRLKA